MNKKVRMNYIKGGRNINTLKQLREATFIPDKAFPINVFFTGEIGLHWHDHMEWILVKEGKASVQVDDVFVQMQKGDIAFVNPKQLHAARLLEEKTELIAIVFNEAIVRNNGLDNTESLYFSPFLNQEFKLPSFLGNDEHSLNIRDSIFNLVNEFARKEKGFELIIKGELFRIFGLIFRHFCQSGNQPVYSLQKNYKLTGLLDYLRENYNQEMSVAEAAKMVNLSPNHFCKIFKKVTGKTLIEYLHLLRINEAEKMLLETDSTVSEIAEKVGFGSITYFGRVFKKIKNVPPSVLRGGPVKINR